VHQHDSGQLPQMFEIKAKTFGKNAPLWRAEE